MQPNFLSFSPLACWRTRRRFTSWCAGGLSAKSAQMQSAVVKEFPNVSTIDLTLIVQTVDSILRKVSFVIRFMALFTLGTGLTCSWRASWPAGFSGCKRAFSFAHSGFAQTILRIQWWSIFRWAPWRLSPYYFGCGGELGADGFSVQSSLLVFQ